MATELWQEEIRQAITSVRDLRGYAFLENRFASLGDVEERFRTLVSPYYLGLIDPLDPEDPIAKMAFPSSEELLGSGLRDPIGDLAKQAAKRLTHRYKDRALLHVTNLCPMYCRFCFRKNLMNEKEEELYSGDFAEAFSYVGKHPEIEEVIFTGGDPWMLSDARLENLVSALDEAAPHVKRIRFHTRMPVTLPARVTDQLVAVVNRPGRFQTYVVTHFNHPRELTDEAKRAVEKLRLRGITVLNQGVLLRGVNDSVKALRELFLGLGSFGVLPYYLHQCDEVAGGEHFRVPLNEGQAIWRSLRGTLPGYLLPEYVIDQPGGLGKIPVGWV